MKNNNEGQYQLGKKLLKFPFLIVNTTVFLSISFYIKLWHPTWMINILTLVYYSYAISLTNDCLQAWKKSALYWLSFTSLYLFLGLTYNIWHPTWLLFSVPIVMQWFIIISKDTSLYKS